MPDHRAASRPAPSPLARLALALLLLAVGVGADCSACQPTPSPCGFACPAGQVRACVNHCVQPVPLGEECNLTDPCAANGTCVAGTLCVPVPREDGTSVGVCLGVPPGGLGDRCTPTASFNPCGPGLFCNGPANCPNGGTTFAICGEYAHNGAHCDSNADQPGCAPCEPGTHCGTDGVCHATCDPAHGARECPCDRCVDGGCPNQVCLATPAGGECSRCVGFGQACGDGVACCDPANFACGANRSCCVTDGGAGCRATGDCCDPVNRRCFDGRCAACRRVGQACAGRADCCNGLICFGGACDACHGQGQACGGDADCCGGFQCVAGRCLKRDGQPCVNGLGAQCASGACTCGLCGHGIAAGGTCGGGGVSLATWDCLCRAGEPGTHCEDGRCRHVDGCSRCPAPGNTQSCPNDPLYNCDEPVGGTHDFCCGLEHAPCSRLEDCCSQHVCQDGRCHFSSSCFHGFCGEGHAPSSGCTPPTPDPCADGSCPTCGADGTSCGGPADGPCCRGLGCGYRAGASGTVCTHCAMAGQECFTNGLSCCAQDAAGRSQGDCVLLPGTSHPVCADLSPRCLDSHWQCRFIGPGGTTVENCCADDTTGAPTSCPADGFCP